MFERGFCNYFNVDLQLLFGLMTHDYSVPKELLLSLQNDCTAQSRCYMRPQNTREQYIYTQGTVQYIEQFENGSFTCRLDL